MTTKEITPEDSACPVFVVPLDPAQVAADNAERQLRAEEKESKTIARQALLQRLGITDEEAKLLLS